MGRLSDAGIHIDTKNSRMFYDPNDSRYLIGQVWDKEFCFLAGEMKYDIALDHATFLYNGDVDSPYVKWAMNDDFMKYLKDMAHKYMERHPQPKNIIGAKESHDLSKLVKDIKKAYGKEPSKWPDNCVTLHLKNELLNVPVEAMIVASISACKEAMQEHTDNPKVNVVTGEDSFGRKYSKSIDFKDIEAISGNNQIFYETEKHGKERYNYQLAQRIEKQNELNNRNV